MSKKRTTFEDKRNIVKAVLQEKEDFYQLKDIEKICQSSKGIRGQLVKEIVQSLLDDNLIESDKIGTSLYYWSFKYKQLLQLKNEIRENNHRISELQELLKSATVKIDQLNADDGQIKEARNLMKLKDKLAVEVSETKISLNDKSELSSEALLEKKNKLDNVVDAANAWTDLIFSLKGLIKNFNTASEDDVNKYFEIDPHLDYISKYT
ncbi:hypothetical protein GJ496_001056 [Pomphorhynchus laevis]|nr:hypothetical protein GJ496_001056 [Pomphorhynchus laevis]